MENSLKYFFLFFPNNNLHEMSKPVLLNMKNACNVNLSSAELAESEVKF